MKAVKFKNFSDKDFTWSFDSIPYTFGAGQETFLEDYKAEHFCKHLVDRELNAKNIPTNNLSARKPLEELCYPFHEVITPQEALDTNERTEAPAKVEEEEFPDLKVEKVRLYSTKQKTIGWTEKQKCYHSNREVDSTVKKYT